MDLTLIIPTSGAIGFIIQIVIYNRKAKWRLFLLPVVLLVAVAYTLIRYSGHTSILDPLSIYPVLANLIYLPGLIGSIFGGIVAVFVSHITGKK